MKVVAKILALALILSAGLGLISQKVSAQESGVSFQLFYDQLSPYGSWVVYQNYGYVWIPDVDREFSPYSTDGHWVYTEDGWTWVSNYSWGWAPFHYGRWAYDDFYGWMWVPHNEWGPAWVTWRRSEGYYGWAPMGPGITLEVSFGGGYRPANERWTFVRDRDISRPDIDRHYVDRSTNVTIINHSTVINNTYTDNFRHTKYAAGPAREDVQKFSGTAIRPVVIRENDKPGQSLNDDQLRIYRPQVQSGSSADRKPIPPNLVALKEVKPISERKQINRPQNDNLPANGQSNGSPTANGNQSGNKSPGAPFPVVSPPGKNGRDEHPSGGQTTMSPQNNGKGMQPRVVIPPEKNEGIKKPLAAPTIKPSDNNKGETHPRVVIPSDRIKSSRQPPGTQTAKPPANSGKGIQPRVVIPPDNRKNIEQSSKAKNIPQPNSKALPPKMTRPPDNKVHEPGAQPPKSGKEKE